MKCKSLITTCLLALILLPSIMYAGADDFFRSTGKIYTVLAVMIILFCILFAYLIRLDGKISKLEKQIKK